MTDVQMFAVCVAIQAETGGNLADILDGLANVIRERNSMVLKVRALSSEGKMTAWVLSALLIGLYAPAQAGLAALATFPLILVAAALVGVLPAGAVRRIGDGLRRRLHHCPRRAPPARRH